MWITGRLAFFLMLAYSFVAFSDDPPKNNRKTRFFANHCIPFLVQYDSIVLLKNMSSNKIVVLGISADPIFHASRAQAVLWEFDSLKTLNDLMAIQSSKVARVDENDDETSKHFKLRTTKSSFQSEFEASGISFAWTPFGKKEYWISFGSADMFRIAVLRREDLDEPIVSSRFLSIDEFVRIQNQVGGR